MVQSYLVLPFQFILYLDFMQQGHFNPTGVNCMGVFLSSHRHF
nr:MAG TPA: hypothetical protein [Caudoviricetes sp.]